jgi:amidohydrolase
MPVVNRIAAYAEEMQGWRRHLHAHPELAFDCHQTAAFVAGRLREFGVDDVHEGIAKTGIVAIIEGQGEGPVIGLRADMDALPIMEATGAAHASTIPGKMHACGHDGHTTMLLGAAKYLAETRNFAGKVALIFQPAEESGGGAGVMCAEGLMDRFGIGSVYALHNVPGIEIGQILTTPGPIMAAVDTFEVHITGVGGHGAMPHETADPIPAAIAIAQAMPTIVSRNNYALDDLVISVTQMHAGTVDNVIPSTAYINGTVRTFDAAVQDMVERRMGEIVDGSRGGVRRQGAELNYVRGYPATINEPQATAFAAAVAGEVVGAEKVDGNSGPRNGGGGFRLHAAGTPRRLPLPRCRTRRGAAPSRIRLQRRDRAHRGEHLRPAGGNGAARSLVRLRPEVFA